MRRIPEQVRRIRVWREALYRALGAGGWDEDDAIDGRWPPAVQEAILGRKSKMNLELDLSDWLQRRTYFTGRYYQEDLEDLLSVLLEEGDNFVDVGANIGLLTLHAARLVGSSGTIWAFEPNPPVYERLLRHLRLNELHSSRAYNVGLGREAGTLTMRLFGRHTGKATLVDRPETAASSVTVRTARGDELLKGLNASRPTVIKIDVEGFELAVLEGLGKILDANVALVVEVSRDWLRLAGDSAEELHRMLETRGFVPFGFRSLESRLTRKLVLCRLERVLDLDQYDCLFMRPESVFASRLRHSVES